ncbi:MAG: hypothetical protein GXP15_01270 [Gammaproteobacteria bacterium]|nr:hypothetical protein [Gammaproteobacteria bacterium]
MAATLSTVYESRDFGEQIEARMQEMERFADAGEWDEIARILQSLPGLISRIPEQARRDILLAARNRVDRVHTRAIEQSEEIGSQLASLKTGQRATASYRATGALATNR